MKLVILAIGEVNLGVLRHVLHGLKQAFPQVQFTVSENVMPIPKEAYNKYRQQYHSTRLLAKMLQHVNRSGTDRILGVTAFDLYVSRFNFVFGEAQFAGRAALISLFRLSPEFYGQPADNKLFYERVVKEAVHEAGHIFGLAHCKNSHCVMFFSNSILDTDRKYSMLCEKCSDNVSDFLRGTGFRLHGFRIEVS
jgi:archaemetzincin